MGICICVFEYICIGIGIHMYMHRWLAFAKNYTDVSQLTMGLYSDKPIISQKIVLYNLAYKKTPQYCKIKDVNCKVMMQEENNDQKIRWSGKSFYKTFYTIVE